MSTSLSHSAAGLHFLHSFFCQLSVNTSCVAIHMNLGIKLHMDIGFLSWIHLHAWMMSPGSPWANMFLLPPGYMLPFCVWAFSEAPHSFKQDPWCLCTISYSLQYATPELKEVVNQLSWLSLLRTIFQTILPRRPLNGRKSSFLKVMAVILLFALLSAIQILNSSTSWPLQPRLILTFTSSTCHCLFARNRSPTTCIEIWASMHARSFLYCLFPAVLSPQKKISMVQVPDKQESLWTLGLCCLRKSSLLLLTHKLSTGSPISR